MVGEFLDYIINLNESLQNIYYLTILVALFVTFSQLKSCIKSNNINLFDKVYTENKKIRECQIDARTQLRLMMTEIEEDPKLGTELKNIYKKSTDVARNKLLKDKSKNPNWKEIKKTKDDIRNDYKTLIANIPRKFIDIFKFRSNLLKYRLKNFPYYLDKSLDPVTTRDKIECGNRFTDIYFKDIYKDFRETGYHYEYLGIIVKYDMIPFKLVFDMITWPDDFWNESYYIRDIVRRCWLPDFWENAEYLHDLYMDARIKKLILSNSRNFNDENLIYSRSFILIDSKGDKFNDKDLSCNDKISNSHSNLSAYQDMSKKAYEHANLFKEIAKKIQKIGDMDYEEYKQKWRTTCLTEEK